MAKAFPEKLTRQMSLIEYLMAVGRPVTAVEVARNIESYHAERSTRAAFDRRFGADRADLESLGIEVEVHLSNKEATYTLSPESFYLPAIDVTEDELRDLHVVLSALGDKCAYVPPVRSLLECLSWARPEAEPAERPFFPGPVPSSSQQLLSLDLAIHRRKKVKFVYHGKVVKVEPHHLYYIAGEFYLVARSGKGKKYRVLRVSHIESKVRQSTKADHDFKRPKNFDQTKLFTGIDWQLGDSIGTARIWLAECIVDEASKAFESGVVAGEANGGTMFDVPYSDNSQLKAWVASFGCHARRLLLTSEELDRAVARKRVWEDIKPLEDVGEGGRIQPDALARVVRLAGILVRAGQDGSELDLQELCERLWISERELRQVIDLLNLVSFGEGGYILYAEVKGNRIEVDAEAYGDTFSRPMRLLPLELRALLFVIDLALDSLAEDHPARLTLVSLREKIVRVMGSGFGLKVLPARSPSVAEPEGVS